MWHNRKGKIIGKEKRLVVVRAWGLWGIKWKEKIWGVMRLFYTCMVVVVTWLYAFVKTWRNVYWKRVNGIVCELYLNLKKLKFLSLFQNSNGSFPFLPHTGATSTLVTGKLLKLSTFSKSQFARQDSELGISFISLYILLWFSGNKWSWTHMPPYLGLL